MNFSVYSSILSLFVKSLWIVIPLVLFYIALDFYLRNKKLEYLKNISWKFLEVKIPVDISRSAKAMEEVFSALHIISSKPNFWDKFTKGKVADWLVFEIFGRGGEIHFYVRCQEKHRNLVEASIYAHYPEAEVKEVEDYTESFSSLFSSQYYDLYAAEFKLEKENAYPIKTYSYFEDKEEEKNIDPLSSIAEVISNLKSDETILIQLLIRPADKNKEWVKKGEEIISEIIGTKIKKKNTFGHLSDFLGNLARAPFSPPVWTEEEKKESKYGSLTSGQKNMIEAIETKISKLAYEVSLRFLYIDNKDEFTERNVTSVLGAFRQYSSYNIFKKKDLIGKYKFFKEKKTMIDKEKVYSIFIKRIFPDDDFFILDTEELATIYHYPTILIKAPLVREKKAKRGGPPLGLPMV